MSKNEKTNTIKGSIISILIGVGITVLLLGGFILLIKLDIAGLGNQVMRPLINDVPVLNLMLPKEKVRENQLEIDKKENPYAFETVEEAVYRLKELEVVVANKNSEIRNLNEETDRLRREVSRLQEFENRYIDFLEDKSKFDEVVVFNDKAPDINEYKQFYESIFPQNAAQIYERVIEQYLYDEQAKKYAETYQSMKPGEAARILETMTTDLDLVVLILKNINTEQRAKILGAMNPTTAARITRMMAP
ncbi:flagellar motility protein MotE (MotC chaperone) [Natranaerovirga pectinivora]|uniref:Flagellar motility protein MotE (MotC chaperone) n=1 Tax=Natranaerovirga pectinivora TaxID=682400 RepID=A0A4R3MTN1_9FIRM|nr:hypothetical protein [Natranaerovirga pectinivora]TCT16424.1 flagellar motility protein MotE (MotC chaperone) [Natranaerovirga pectinivora]